MKKKVGSSRNKQNPRLPSPPLFVHDHRQPQHHHRRLARVRLPRIPRGQSFQFKVKYYGLNCIMVSFPTRRQAGRREEQQRRAAPCKQDSITPLNLRPQRQQRTRIRTRKRIRTHNRKTNERDRMTQPHVPLTSFRCNRSSLLLLPFFFSYPSSPFSFHDAMKLATKTCRSTPGTCEHSMGFLCCLDVTTLPWCTVRKVTIVLIPIASFSRFFKRS